MSKSKIRELELANRVLSDQCAELSAQFVEMNQNCISLSLHESRMAQVEEKLAQTKIGLDKATDIIADLTAKLAIAEKALDFYARYPAAGVAAREALAKIRGEK